MKKIILLAVIVLSTLSVLSQDDSLLNLIGTWHANSDEKDYPSHLISFMKDGQFTQRIEYESDTFIVEGTFKIASDTLEFRYTNSILTDSYIIERVNKDSLVLIFIPDSTTATPYRAVFTKIK